MARILVTGRPGAGKTTLALQAIERLRERGERLAGFTTREIRRGGRRTGFLVTGIGGLERQLAVKGSPGPRVGPYGVDVAAFEEVALVELSSGIETGAILVVDEIGKMELLSDPFRELLDEVFRAPCVLATVHAHRHPVTDALRRRDDVEVVRLDPGNRDVLVADVVERVLETR